MIAKLAPSEHRKQAHTVQSADHSRVCMIKSYSVTLRLQSCSFSLTARPAGAEGETQSPSKIFESVSSKGESAKHWEMVRINK